VGNYHYVWTKKKPLPKGFRTKDSSRGQVRNERTVISWREKWTYPNFEKKSRKSEMTIKPSGHIEFWQEDHAVPGKFYPLILSVTSLCGKNRSVATKTQSTSVDLKHGTCIIETPVGTLNIY